MKAEDTSVELCSRSRGLCFGFRQIESMLIMKRIVFVPRLIYNCNLNNHNFSNLHKIKSFELLVKLSPEGKNKMVDLLPRQQQITDS